MSDEATWRLRVRGRVQGVGFRFYTERSARSLGVRGEVANLPDGSVEVIAQGTPEALAGLEAAMRRGPRFSAVSGVEREVLENAGRFPAFTVSR